MSLLAEPTHEAETPGGDQGKEGAGEVPAGPAAVAHGTGLVTNQVEKLVSDQRSRPEAPETDLVKYQAAATPRPGRSCQTTKSGTTRTAREKGKGRQEKLAVASRCQPLCSKRRVTLKDKENKKERTAKEKPQTGATKEKPKERRKERPLMGPKAKVKPKPRLPHPLQGKGPWWKLSLTPKPGQRPSPDRRRTTTPTTPPKRSMLPAKTQASMRGLWPLQGQLPKTANAAGLPRSGQLPRPPTSQHRPSPASNPGEDQEMKEAASSQPKPAKEELVEESDSSASHDKEAKCPPKTRERSPSTGDSGGSEGKEQALLNEPQSLVLTRK